jgi:hypothetical protein
MGLGMTAGSGNLHTGAYSHCPAARHGIERENLALLPVFCFRGSRLNFSIDESDACAGHPIDPVPTTEKRGQITGYRFQSRMETGNEV